MTEGGVCVRDSVYFLCHWQVKRSSWWHHVVSRSTVLSITSFFISANNCGLYPTIQYAVVKAEPMYLRYRCDDYHTLVGLDTVVCQSNRWWSRRPVCKGMNKTMPLFYYFFPKSLSESVTKYFYICFYVYFVQRNPVSWILIDIVI